MAKMIHYEYHRPGRSVSLFRQWLVLDRPDAKVLVSESYEGPDLTVGNAVIHESGAPMVWYVFPEKWHDIGRFHRANGTFTGWYTNFIQPVEIHDDKWSASDLFLDLWQPVDGEMMWLDQDQLDEATRSGVIDRATRRRIDNERVIVDLQAQTGAWPPPIARDIDLIQAKALMAT